MITVPEGKEKPYATNGHFYLRQGTNSQQMNRNEIRGFFQEEGLVLFDEQASAKFDINSDFDDAKFEIFKRQANINTGLKKEDVLRNLLLLDCKKLRNAGILFFCRRVTSFFMSATITCALYEGNSKTNILDVKEFDEDLQSNFNNAFVYVCSKLNTNYIIKDKLRIEKLEIPKEAIREAILNAVAHRNYFSNANIQVSIFKDRLEIVNPGGLVKGMHQEELGRKSMPRNHLLFSLMQRVDLVEKIGSGILRIRESMQECGLKKPLFEINDDWFTIILSRPGEDSGEKTVEKTVEKILRLIIEKPNITQKEILSKTGLSRRGVEWNISRLKERGILRRCGPDKGGRWEVLKK
jgi:ATP-dependent DNA helicase RecG